MVRRIRQPRRSQKSPPPRSRTSRASARALPSTTGGRSGRDRAYAGAGSAGQRREPEPRRGLPRSRIAWARLSANDGVPARTWPLSQEN
jgi:hypothetical protein